MADNQKNTRKLCLLLITILFALVVLLIGAWVFLPPVLNDYLNDFFLKRNMDGMVYLWCLEYTNKSEDECVTWMHDVMAQHRDEIMTCAGNNVAVYDCITDLGLEP